MKSIKVLFLLVTLVSTTLVKADYLCSSNTGIDSTLIVDENQITQLGDTVVILKSEKGDQYFFGKIVNEGGHFLKKKVIEFSGSDDMLSVLTVTLMPKNCGRASCDFGGETYVSATLNLGESQTQFSCDGTK